MTEPCPLHESLRQKVNDLEISINLIHERLPQNLIQTLTSLDSTVGNLNNTLKDIKENLIPKGEYLMVRNVVIGLVSLILMTVGGAVLAHILTK